MIVFFILMAWLIGMIGSFPLIAVKLEIDPIPGIFYVLGWPLYWPVFGAIQLGRRAKRLNTQYKLQLEAASPSDKPDYDKIAEMEFDCEVEGTEDVMVRTGPNSSTISTASYKDKLKDMKNGTYYHLYDDSLNRLCTVTMIATDQYKLEFEYRLVGVFTLRNVFIKSVAISLRNSDGETIMGTVDEMCDRVYRMKVGDKLFFPSGIRIVKRNKDKPYEISGGTTSGYSFRNQYSKSEDVASELVQRLSNI